MKNNQRTDSNLKIAFQTVVACMAAVVGENHVTGLQAAGDLYTYAAARFQK